MEPFRVYILGCGSALPTLKHNASSQVVEMRGKFFMVDCGEGTQIQLRRSRIHFSKISAVFISHIHGDHCLGLIGMISTFGMLGRTSPLHIYAPAEFEPILNVMMQTFCNGLEYKVTFHPVDTKANKVIFEEKGLQVETIPLEHRIACCGFIFREKASLPHIRRDMIDCYEIPVSQINNIKNGADWTTPDGEVIANDKLTFPADKPRSYAYCSDTRYIPTLHNLVKDVDTLYHESTYTSDFESNAKRYYHSTAAQAATVARDANVKQLVLGHFSARNEDEKGILTEAVSVFPNSILANEGMRIDV